jgi:hypothetical protein
MRETRQSGSEGGARLNPLSLPLSVHFGGGELRRGQAGRGKNKYSFHLVLVWLTPGQKSGAKCRQRPAFLFCGSLLFAG